MKLIILTSIYIKVTQISFLEAIYSLTVKNWSTPSKNEEKIWPENAGNGER